MSRGIGRCYNYVTLSKPDNIKSGSRWLFIWPAAAILITVLAAANPFYRPEISLGGGTTAWLVAMTVAFMGWLHPLAARAAVLLTGLFLAVPCFLNAPPLFRGWLMVCMLLPLAIVSVPILVPSVTGFRARLALLCSWDETRPLQRRPASFQTGSLLQLILSAAIFAAAIAAVIVVPASGFWLLARWLAGGIIMMAAAEMITAFHNFLTALLGITTPSLMQSPCLATSVGEFWTRRWNPGTSMFLRRCCFEPLAGCSPTLGLWAAFAVSGVGHALLFYMAGGRWGIALANGAFFVVQPLFILAERQMNIRRWPMAALRAWTLTILAITSPLFIEPGLQLAQASFVQGSILPPALFAVSLVVIIQGFFLLAALFACPRGEDVKAPLRNPPANPQEAK